MPKVSVIIPVYNVEKYLRECLDSVRAQTLKEIEIICIDDGSTDSSGEILDEYAFMDARFRVVHKENEGYGKTMNMGLRMAMAPYVGIVESDDMVPSNMYEELFQIMEETHVDITKADFFEFYESKERSYIEEYVSLGSGEVLENLYEKVFGIQGNEDAFLFLTGTWSGLYRREFLMDENILYNETPGASYQDQGFWLQTMIKAKSMYFVKKAFYRYRIDNPNSSMYDKGKVFAVRGEYDYVHKILSEMGEEGEAFYPWLSRLKIVYCYYNISRVADEYKVSLAEQIRKDMWQAAQSGELDADLFDDGWKCRLFSLMADPEAFVQKIMKRRQELERKVKAYDVIILYGAGKIGRKAQKLLKEGRMNTKIKYFAVTDVAANPDVVLGIPVKPIEKLGEYRENALVVISVGEKYLQEIRSVLKERGFKHCITYKDLM